MTAALQDRRLLPQRLEFALQPQGPTGRDDERGDHRGGGKRAQDREAAAAGVLLLPGGAQHARAQQRVGAPQRRVERDQVGDLLILGKLPRRARIVPCEILDGAGLGAAEPAQRVGGEQIFAFLRRHDRFPPSCWRRRFIARRVRVLTVPSGVSVSAAISVCVSPSK